MVTHAKLGASNAHRWMLCAASPRLEQDIPNTTSEFAEEGTAAHEEAEKVLLGKLAIGDAKAEIELYTEYVIEILMGTGGAGENLYVEQKLQYTDWVEDGFGTADVVIIDQKHDTLHVIDLKYGKGIRVDAEHNPQLRLYALGALQKWYFEFEPSHVMMHIVQPRLDHISTETLTVDALMDWGETIKLAAQATLDPKVKPTPGEKQCQWCKAKGVCRERAIHALQLRDMDTISIDEIAMVLPFAEEVTSWATGLKAHALKMAEEGTRFPGYKLVEGQSQRRWKDDAEKELLKLVDDKDSIYNKKLLGLGDMQKLVGKEAVNKLCYKPAGKPALVLAADKRPEIVAENVAFENLDEMEKQNDNT